MEHEDLTLNPKHLLTELRVLVSSVILDLPRQADLKGHLELSGELAFFRVSRKFCPKN